MAGPGVNPLAPTPVQTPAQATQTMANNQARAQGYAKNAGFSNAVSCQNSGKGTPALDAIVAVDETQGYTMTQADYNRAFLTTKGGTDCSMYAQYAVNSANPISSYINFSGLLWRFAEGVLGGVILIIGLMMLIKQVAGVSVTGVPGRVGKVFL
jgi:hypothetical protein